VNKNASKGELLLCATADRCFLKEGEEYIRYHPWIQLLKRFAGKIFTENELMYLQGCKQEDLSAYLSELLDAKGVNAWEAFILVFRIPFTIPLQVWCLEDEDYSSEGIIELTYDAEEITVYKKKILQTLPVNNPTMHPWKQASLENHLCPGRQICIKNGKKAPYLHSALLLLLRLAAKRMGFPITKQLQSAGGDIGKLDVYRKYPTWDLFSPKVYTRMWTALDSDENLAPLELIRGDHLRYFDQSDKKGAYTKREKANYRGEFKNGEFARQDKRLE